MTKDTSLNSRKYYTLLVLEDGCWAPQFGDYDKAVVEEELEDIASSVSNPVKRKHLKIICTSDDQISIKAAVEDLNSNR